MQRISIFGIVDSFTSDNLKTQLDSLDRAQPLTVEINSDGGSVADGIAIYNMLRGWPGGVTVEVVGWALSIASVILQAGAKRIAHEAALIMVHAPWTSTTGNANSMTDAANLLVQVGETMATIYRRTGQKESIISGWMDGEDHWFSAAEALSLGLIDEVISNTDSRANAMKKQPANASAHLHKIPLIYSQRISMPSVNIPELNAAAVAAAADLQRRADISTRFQAFANRDGVAALQAACERDVQMSADAAAQKLLAHLGSQCEPIAGHWVDAGYISNGSDSRLTEFKAAARDVLLARGGIQLPEKHPAARDLQRLGVVGMCEAILSMSGRSTREMSPSAIISAGLSTSDFPALLGNTIGKSMAIGYRNAASGHAVFTAEREVSDFKKQTLVRLSEAPNLEKVPELGEYKNGSLSDSASEFVLETHGKIISISRQALINDDLGSLTKIPQAFGQSARRFEADKVFAILNSNPVLNDGYALFSSKHGNIETGAFNLSTLASARAAMRKQKDIAGLSFIDVQPKYLIVPVALETAAEQLINSLLDPRFTHTDVTNVEFVRNLVLVSDPRLDAVSETRFYLSAAPDQIEGILRAYLAGEDRPHLEEESEFRRDVLSYKVRLDFAAGVMDHRGLYRVGS